MTLGTIEAVAAAFGILSVYLSTRQIVWSWPTALINLSLYAAYFFAERLYALTVLQGVFIAISIYGWYEWLHGGAQHSALRVSRIPVRLALALTGLGAVTWVALIYALRRFTEDPSPVIDAALTTMSLIAQWMMARKYVECWLLWTAVNLVSVPFFLIRGDLPTAIQYLVFLGLAPWGYVQWRASLRLAA